MRRTPVPRKAAFKAALAYAGITEKQWREARGVSPTHLHAVLTGQRDSATLVADVERFIAEHTPQHAAA